MEQRQPSSEEAFISEMQDLTGLSGPVTGLVAEGGGMKCAYGAGVLDAFLDDGLQFPYCIGVSAGSANVASYLGGQRGRNIRFYVEHTQERDYFGAGPFVKTGNMFNLRYIYGTLSNSTGADPLDFARVMKNPARFRIVATDAETGRPHYFEKTEMAQDDYRAIMASCALPALCRPVRIGSRSYYDGGVSDAIPVRRALTDGCEKVVVLLSKPRSFVMQPQNHHFAYSRACRRYPRVVQALERRHIMYRQQQKLLFALEKEGRAFLFTPAADAQMSTYSMDPEANKRLYEQGLADYRARRGELLAFLETPVPGRDRLS